MDTQITRAGKTTCRSTTFFVAVLTLLSSAVFAADEPSAPPSKTSPGVVGKVEHALDRAAKATESGVEHGAKATAHGIKRGVTAAEKGVLRGARATENVTHKVADKVTGSSDKPSSGKTEANK